MDSSAVMLSNSLNFENMITTELIRKEIKDFRSKMLFESGKIKIFSPCPESILYVKEKAKETGDIDRLSEADISILALAYEKKGILVTEDYAVQNTAKKMRITVKSVFFEGIKKEREYLKYCPVCKKGYSIDSDECDICGFELIRKWKQK